MTDAPAPPDEARIEAAVRGALDAAAARYEVLACDPAFADTTEFCARYGIDPQDSANAILVASRREPKVHALCLVLATTRLGTRPRGPPQPHRGGDPPGAEGPRPVPRAGHHPPGREPHGCGSAGGEEAVLRLGRRDRPADRHGAGGCQSFRDPR